MVSSSHLPSQANVLAVHHADPQRREEVRRRMRAGGDFAAVSEPVEGWVLGVAPLPGAVDDPEQVRSAGLVFTEGRDRVRVSSPADVESLVRLVVDEPERFDRLGGDVGLLHLRPHGEATAFRSPGGLVPLYGTSRRDHAAIATRIGCLRRYLPGPHELDPLVCGAWASGWAVFPDHRTFLRDVTIVPRGQYAEVQPRRAVQPRVFWDPWPTSVARPADDTRREHVQRLRRLLLAALRADLDPDGGNLLSLSGGVDSSAIAAIAAGHLGRPLMTVSVLPSDPEASAHERSYIDPLLTDERIGPSWFAAGDWRTRLALRDAAPQVGFPMLHPVLGALPEIARQDPVRVLVGGEFADEVCGTMVAFADWAAQVGPFDALRARKRLPQGQRHLLRWAKSRARWAVRRPGVPWPADLSSLIRPEVRSEYREWRERHRRESARAPVAHRYLRLRSQHDGWLPMNWEAATALGVRRSVPFHTRGMLELLGECHLGEQLEHGPKRLLRTAVDDLVPERNLWRPDRGHHGEADAETTHEADLHLPAELATVLDDAWLEPARQRPTRFEAFFLAVLRDLACGGGIDRAARRPPASILGREGRQT